MSRTYTPDVAGVAALMGDKAADRLDQFLMFTSDHLAEIACNHDIAHEDSPDCGDCGQIWPCRTYRSAQTLATAWLLSEVRGHTP